jgi:hypothetical protein
MKECPSDKIYNEATKRCVLKNGKIGKAILAGSYKKKNESKVKKLKKVQNLKKKTTIKECPSDKIYNEATKRCVLKTGKIGKLLLKNKQAQNLKKIQAQNLKKIQAQNLKKIQAQNLKKIQAQNLKKIQAQNLKKIQAQKKQAQNLKKIQAQNLKKIQAQNLKKIQAQNLKKIQAQKKQAQNLKKIQAQKKQPQNLTDKQIQNLKKIQAQNLKKKQIQNEKNITNYINENYSYNPKSVEIVLRQNPNLKLFVEIENFLYKKKKQQSIVNKIINFFDYSKNKKQAQQIQNLKKKQIKNEYFTNIYKYSNNMDKKMTLSEIKNKIEKDNTEDKYDFSKLQSVKVPFVDKIYDSLNSLARELKYSNHTTNQIYVTPSYRFSIPWLIEQHQYIASLPEEERIFLYFYVHRGDQAINAFLRYNKITNDAYNKILCILPTLKKIYTIIFKKKATLAEIQENFHLLFSVAIKKMNEIIKKSPPLPEDMLVFRGQSRNFNPNNTGFISTSLNTQIASDFAENKCCKIYFILKKGTHALAIFLLGKNYEEQEVLLPYDIKLNLIEKNSTKINKKSQHLSSVDVYEASN